MEQLVKNQEKLLEKITETPLNEFVTHYGKVVCILDRVYFVEFDAFKFDNTRKNFVITNIEINRSIKVVLNTSLHSRDYNGFFGLDKESMEGEPIEMYFKLITFPLETRVRDYIKNLLIRESCIRISDSDRQSYSTVINCDMGPGMVFNWDIENLWNLDGISVNRIYEYTFPDGYNHIVRQAPMIREYRSTSLTDRPITPSEFGLKFEVCCQEDSMQVREKVVLLHDLISQLPNRFQIDENIRLIHYSPDFQVRIIPKMKLVTISYTGNEEVIPGNHTLCIPYRVIDAEYRLLLRHAYYEG